MKKYAVELELGGKTRSLCIDFMTAAKLDEYLEPRYRYGFLAALTLTIGGNINYDIIGTMIYYGIADEDKSLTREGVMKMLSEEIGESRLTVEKLQLLINRAVTNSGILKIEPEGEGDKEKDPLLSTDG